MGVTTMTGDRKRTLILLGVVALLALLVAWDRGLLGGSGEPTLQPRQRYELVNAQLRLQRDLLESEGAMTERRDQARRAWEGLRGRLVTAPTPEVAPAELRERVNAELRRHGVRAMRVLGEEVREAAEAGDGTSRRVIPIRIRITFDAPDSQTLYGAIAALDGTERFHARVSELTIRGGGVNTQAEGVTATLSIDTAVLLGEDTR
ncbi:MAG: hypothetical protein ACIAQF_10600 [Phycisphaerales bacterium JB065]